MWTRSILPENASPLTGNPTTEVVKAVSAQIALMQALRAQWRPYAL
jgi:hypothetical protein